ncbi:MAG: hypothetical protein GF331_17515, partial [Chitinivibrionales bacterium]|nr:hypothetical protein [Chitinivibrionales bacterium]
MMPPNPNDNAVKSPSGTHAAARTARPSGPRYYLQALRDVLIHGAYGISRAGIFPLLYLALVGYPSFYLILSRLGFRENILVRASAVVIAAVMLYVLPRRQDWRVGHKVFFEIALVLILPLHFAFFFVLNDYNAYWYASTIFACLSYGMICGRALLAMVVWPVVYWGLIALWAVPSGRSEAFSSPVVGAFLLGWFSVLAGGVLNLATGVLHH